MKKHSPGLITAAKKSKSKRTLSWSHIGAKVENKLISLGYAKTRNSETK